MIDRLGIVLDFKRFFISVSFGLRLTNEKCPNVHTTNNFIIVKTTWINIEINLILWMRACASVFLYLVSVRTVGIRLLWKKNMWFSFGFVHTWAWPLRTPNLFVYMHAHAHTFTHMGLIRKYVIMFNARQCVRTRSPKNTIKIHNCD